MASYKSKIIINPPGVAAPPPKDKTNRMREYSSNYSNSAGLPNLPTAEVGINVPYVIGTRRIDRPNVIWYGNLQPLISTTQETSETSETVTNDDGSTTTNITINVVTNREVIGYTFDMQMGLCLGDGVHLRKIYNNDLVIWSGDEGPERTAINATFTFFGGEYDQNIDPMFADLSPLPPAYRGLAYCIVKGSSPTGTPVFHFEVGRYPNPLGLDDAVNKSADGLDINPATALYDRLSSEWGGMSVPVDFFDTASFISAAALFAAEDNYMSALLENDDVSDFIELVQAQTRSILVEDHRSGKLKLIPIRAGMEAPDDPHFDEDNVNRVISLSRYGWDDVPSAGRASFVDRVSGYRASLVTGQNLALVSDVSKRPSTFRAEYPFAMSGARVAQLLARDMGLISRPYYGLTLQTLRTGGSLLAGQVLSFSWGQYNIEDLVFHVGKRKDHAVSSPYLTYELLESRDDAQDLIITEYVPYSGSETTLDVDALVAQPLDALAITAPAWMVFNGAHKSPQDTRFLDASAYNSAYSGLTFADMCTQIVIAIPANENQALWTGSCTNHTGVPYRVVFGTGSKYANRATLGTAISDKDGWTTGEIATIQIHNAVSSAYLDDVLNPRGGTVFLFINDEILTYTTATDDGNGSWTLGGVKRCLLDTGFQSHDLGDFVYIADTRFVNGRRYSVLGSSAPDYEIVATGINGLATTASALDPYTFTGPSPADKRAARTLRVQNVKIGGARSLSDIPVTIGASVTVSWSIRSRQYISQLTWLDDPSHTRESLTGANHTFDVVVTDALGTPYVVATTIGNAATFTLPVMEEGVGFVFVRGYYAGASYSSYITDSQQDEIVPIVVSA